MALLYGADAVYLAGEAYGMRASSCNFGRDAMEQAVSLCHRAGAELHVTCNTLPREQELAALPEYLGFLQEIGVDALIIADLGVFALARQFAPRVRKHVSTQLGVINSATANELFRMGADTVVLARETTMEEIRQIRNNTPPDLKLEAFVHGAMCVSFSGRCLLSNYLTGRDANRGQCAQPCRWKYHLVEEKRPGQYFEITEDGGTHIMNSRDMRMIEHIPELLEAGVSSLKIEGRMKTALYVASITRAYRRAIDDYLESDEKYAAGMDWYRQEIRKCTYRDFTTGFYFGRPDTQSMVYTDNTYASDATFLGIVEKDPEAGRACAAEGCSSTARAAENGSTLPEIVAFRQKNKFSVGETIEIMCPDGRDIAARVLGMWNAEGEAVQSAPHPGELIRLQLDAQAVPGDILRISR